MVISCLKGVGVMKRIIVTLLLMSLVQASAKSDERALDPEIKQTIAQLVSQLDADTATQREEAEAKLVELAGQKIEEIEQTISLLAEAE